MANVLVTKCVSDFGSVNWKDLLKGVWAAFGTSLIASVGQGLQSGHMPSSEQWRIAVMTGLTAGLWVVLNKLFSGPPKTDKL